MYRINVRFVDQKQTEEIVLSHELVQQSTLLQRATKYHTTTELFLPLVKKDHWNLFVALATQQQQQQTDKVVPRATLAHTSNIHLLLSANEARLLSTVDTTELFPLLNAFVFLGTDKRLLQTIGCKIATLIKDASSIERTQAILGIHSDLTEEDHELIRGSNKAFLCDE
jgi:hypothetical protein